jgi:hypothetical protein
LDLRQDALVPLSIDFAGEENTAFEKVVKSFCALTKGGLLFQTENDPKMCIYFDGKSDDIAIFTVELLSSKVMQSLAAPSDVKCSLTIEWE